MKCPGCGLYHPPLYERCVSCGANLGSVSSEAGHKGNGRDEPTAPAAVQTIEPAPEETPPIPPAKRHRGKHTHYSGLPTAAGVAAVLAIILISAGATIFFLTKPRDDERLYSQGLKELSGGQYAFAVKSLEKASAIKPNDARIFLALARAYVGVDQVDKAWDAISQAQQLGAGVVSDPTLASELANYYRQHQQYERAIELLRPLATANIPGKRAELADLDALYGDEALSKGDYDKALKLWEEVRDLREGARYTEADSRLATIYQKLVDSLVQKGDDTGALSYLGKLTTMAQNPTYFEKSAEIYERRGQLELAIDQLRKAARLAGANSTIHERLAAIMAKRGKELLDAGDTAAGYGYLQEARALDPVHNTVPTVTVRSIQIAIDPLTANPHLSGEVWNPGPNQINQLSLRIVLVDTIGSRNLWEQTKRVIDEFEPPLDPQAAKPFIMDIPVAVKENGMTAVNVYLNGDLYKSYPIGKRSEKDAAAAAKSGDTPKPAAVAPQRAPKPEVKEQAPPPTAPNVVQPQNAPELAPSIPTQAPQGQPEQPAPEQPQRPATPEDKTMQDLDF
jgi:tetratricopeptide (TPR) repeat protein